MRSNRRKYVNSPLQLLLVGILLISSFNHTNAQVYAGEDVTISRGLPIRLSGLFEGYTGLPVTAQDDYFVGPFDIGFTFEFFGENHTQFAIGPNGVVSFDIDHIFDVFEFEKMPVPNSTFTKSILVPYQDYFQRPIDPHNNFIYYRTVGLEPDRRLIVGWCEAPMFDCPSQTVSMQVVLYESDRSVRNHIISKPACEAHQNNSATQAVNYDEFVAVAVPGRNSTSWTAENESWLYEPDGNGSYTVSAIDFEPEPALPQGKISWAWYEGGIQSSEFIDGQRSIVVQPEETATYTCEVTLCSGIRYRDEIEIKTIPLPNAINPKSNVPENRAFRFYASNPEIVEGITMQIFNRWGQEIFQTTNIIEGWDGTVNGNPAMPGVYVWAVTAAGDSHGISNKGTITVVE